jgi:SAM-dependent methyltransferase
MAAFDDDLAGAAISARVGTFYEQHPYPPPVDDLKGYARTWDGNRRRANLHLFWPGEPDRYDRSILVAGCGTSQAAKYALRWPKSQVTGIDFSKTGIERTAKLKRKHSIHNLELRQMSVERAVELGRSFDYVVCTGVLHHLPDPSLGLRALRDVLTPNGAMHLMVYAPYGRAGIYMLQDYCRRLGIEPSIAEMRDLAMVLNALPPDHPLAPLLRNGRDFRDEAGLADTLLNPRDRAYSVPQLFDLLDHAELKFGRWLRQAAYLPTCGALVQSPHRSRLLQLPVQDQYAELELFRGSMVEHSFVAYRSDRTNVHDIDFDGDGWTDYVPIRLPETVVVEEHLPPSAAAVLINVGHTYKDLYLPIDAPQKVLFDAIDGIRPIGDLAPNDADRRTARVLFERLWHYDHVVFDTSPSRARN